MNDTFNIEKIEHTWRHLPPKAQARARSAWEKFQGQGLPSRKEPNWSHTSLEAWKKPWVSEEKNDLSWLEGALSFLKKNDLALVFIDGQFAPKYSRHADQIKWTALSEAHLESAATLSEHSLEQLTWALTSGGVCLEVSATYQALRPVHLIHVSSKKTSGVHNFVHLHSQAKLSLFEIYLAPKTWEAMNLATTTIAVDAGAKMTHLIFHQGGAETFSWKKTQAKVAKDAFYESAILHVGGKLSRHELDLKLKESGAQGRALGLYSLHAHEQSDHYTHIHHEAPHTESFQLYKGILADHAHGVFQGTIHVHEGAHHVAAKQLNRNLLLSAVAQVHTRPQLLIDNDDVKCSHGATIGQLDPEQSFYLESRGLSPEKARQLLAEGFYLEVIGQISCPELQNLALAFLTGKGSAHES